MSLTTPENSDGAKIILTLENTFRKYVALDAGFQSVLALWTLATHLFDRFDAFSYLSVTSPTKGCGKTRVAEIIELLSCGGLRAANASSAAVFRMIQARTAKGQTVTLIMDEMEVLRTNNERSEQLRELLNAGYRRGQSVLRCERNSAEKYDVREFAVYCPKVLVLIGDLTDTLADRCIPIAMRRRKRDERLERFFYSQAEPECKQLQNEMKTWANTNRSKFNQRLLRDLEFLADREAELWLPLFAVCHVAAPNRLEELKAIALRISRGKLSEEPADMGILLLQDIRDVFMRASEARLASSKLLTDLFNIEESPWAGWSNGKGLDARGLARLLRPFKIEPHNLRMGEGLIVKGYELPDFEEAWAMYLPVDLSATPLQAAPALANFDASDPLQEAAVAEEKLSEHLQ